MTCARPGTQRWVLQFKEGPVVGGFSSRHAGNLRACACECGAGACSQLLCELGVSHFALVEAQQVHGNNVFVVTAESLAKTARGGEFPAPRSDALVTALPGVTLFLCFADCLPIFLWLPDGKGIGLVHAGWRGSLARIAEHAVRQLCALTNSPPHDVRARLGPAICRDCYEVGPAVAQPASELPNAERFLHHCAERWHLDLRALNEQILTAAGLRPENIEVSRLCTKCRPDLFFSYRAEGRDCGEMGAFIARQPSSEERHSCCGCSTEH